jgi:hypothetical protein
MVIKLRLGKPHMGKNRVVVSSVYTIRETPREKPGLVRMAGRFRGTWCLHNQWSALMSVRVSPCNPQASRASRTTDCMSQDAIYSDHVRRVYSCEVLLEFLLWFINQMLSHWNCYYLMTANTKLSEHINSLQWCMRHRILRPLDSVSFTTARS